MHVVLRHQLVALIDGRLPAGRLPVFRRNANGQRADHHGREVDQAHQGEGFDDADRGGRLEGVHQENGQRCADHRAAAEAHDGQTGGEAAAIGEPLDQRGHRRDVAEAETDAAEHPIAEIDQPYLVEMDAERRDEEAAAEAAGGDEHGDARADLFQPLAAEGGGEAEEDDGKTEDPAQGGELPVSGRRLGDTDDLGQRAVEDAECIGLANAQMDGQRGRRHHPAVVVGGGDDAIP